jgi:transcription termination factor Rho
MHPVEAMELLVNRGKKTKTNAEFLMTMNLG